MPQRAIFLDRDGVINRYFFHPEFGTVDSPGSPEEFSLVPGVPEAIAGFNRLGFAVFVVSNQPGVAKGRFTEAVLAETSLKMRNEIEAGGGRIDGEYYCLHHPEAAVPELRMKCDCRKPRPGLLLQAAREWDIDLQRSYMIGDGITDIEAGRAAGTRTIFVGQRKPYVLSALEEHGLEADFIAADLARCAAFVAQRESSGNGHTNGSKSEIQTKGNRMSYTGQFLDEAIDILKGFDVDAVERTVDLLVDTRERGGRLFFLGVGGGAGHASHAVCDFRKIGGMEAYTPSDNVSELTARTNDEGWDTSYSNWLRGSRLRAEDTLFIFSVGGGDAERNISTNLVRALQLAKEVGARVCGVVGRDGGYTAKVADACVLVKVPNPETVTPHTEAFQALVWHLIVSHPRLKVGAMKWESVR
jgi:D-sedoheptulose 7-phosphate isomerase